MSEYGIEYLELESNELLKHHRITFNKIHFHGIFKDQVAVSK